jgi:hypothetical protein
MEISRITGEPIIARSGRYREMSVGGLAPGVLPDEDRGSTEVPSLGFEVRQEDTVDHNVQRAMGQATLSGTHVDVVPTTDQF